MEVRESLRTRAMVNAGRLIAKLSTYKIVFTLSSSGYCAIHWLAIHNFSAYVFSSALVFGAMAAMSVAWLAKFRSDPRQRIALATDQQEVGAKRWNIRGSLARSRRCWRVSRTEA
jgi:hypothetical protein